MGWPLSPRALQLRQQRGTPALLCDLGHVTYLLWPWSLHLCQGAFSGSAQLRHSESLLSIVHPWVARPEAGGVCWSWKECEGRRPSGWGPQAGQQAEGNMRSWCLGLLVQYFWGWDPFQAVPQVRPSLGSGFKESGCPFPSPCNLLTGQRE